ncbi:MAG: hypothetical protein M1812_000538 [Candelaria pacifica]|nr:MAG: hypothetical protein M1812_000538 [Candelaria pacifica]
MDSCQSSTTPVLQMAPKASLLTIPNELLHAILARPPAKEGRQKAIATEHLVETVSLFDEQSQVLRLLNIANHPILRKRVTTLVYYDNLFFEDVAKDAAVFQEFVNSTNPSSEHQRPIRGPAVLSAAREIYDSYYQSQDSIRQPLVVALNSFPNLRRIHFSGSPDEDHNPNFFARLKADTLAADCVSFTRQGLPLAVAHSQEALPHFQSVVMAVRMAKFKLKELTTDLWWWGLHIPILSASMPDLSWMKYGLSQLNVLELDMTTHVSASQLSWQHLPAERFALCRVLSYAPKLVRLRLSMRSCDDTTVSHATRIPLGKVLLPELHFPNLRSLTVEGFQFHETTLVSFLESHPRLAALGFGDIRITTDSDDDHDNQTTSHIGYLNLLCRYFRATPAMKRIVIGIFNMYMDDSVVGFEDPLTKAYLWAAVTRGQGGQSLASVERSASRVAFARSLQTSHDLDMLSAYGGIMIKRDSTGLFTFGLGSLQGTP